MKNNRETWKAILQIIGSIIKIALYEEKEDAPMNTLIVFTCLGKAR